MNKEFPVGKAQKMVLDALGITGIETSNQAEAVFEQIGIVVIPVRQGRSSVPSITRASSSRGGWSVYGDGDVSPVSYEKIDFSKIEQWMVK